MYFHRSTQEIYYSTKRQGWLVDQGYSFKIITSLDGLESLPGLVYPTVADQIALLQAVLLANESDADLGSDVKDAKGDLPNLVMSRVGGPSARKDALGQVTRVVGNINSLSGYVGRYSLPRWSYINFESSHFSSAQSMAYVEQNKYVSPAYSLHINTHSASLFDRSANRQLAKDAAQNRNPLFKKKAAAAKKKKRTVSHNDD
jgi:DNA excision repair protein ERCC-3